MQGERRLGETHGTLVPSAFVGLCNQWLVERFKEAERIRLYVSFASATDDERNVLNWYAYCHVDGSCNNQPLRTKYINLNLKSQASITLNWITYESVMKHQNLGLRTVGNCNVKQFSPSGLGPRTIIMLNSSIHKFVGRVLAASLNYR